MDKNTKNTKDTKETEDIKDTKNTDIHAQRIADLAKLIKKLDLDAFIFPTADPHLSEYVSDAYASRKWLSGFTGSAGTLAVDKKGNAALVTDSRYWEQAEKQLKPSGIKLIQAGQPFYTYITHWLESDLKPKSKIGICGKFISEAAFTKLKDDLEKEDLELVDYPIDIATKLEGFNSEPTFNPIYEHEASPRSRQEKFEILQANLGNKVQKVLLTSLEDIAWLTNLRGSDIPNSPLFYSFAIFDKDKGLELFVNQDSVPAPIKEKLKSEGIKLYPYASIVKRLKKLESGTLMADKKTVSRQLIHAIPKSVQLSDKSSPVEILRALKTPEEVALIKKAMEKDGVALVKFFKWLEENVDKGDLTELSCAAKLLEFRKEQEGFVSPSFDTICAFGPNAAQPHYKATEESYSPIKGNGFLLIDSGAQFPEGTTDITRTVLVGKANHQMKKDYTAVLRGNIRLAMATFPNDVPSQVLDVLAREPLWQNCVDYGHGTGHGVGFFLGVHEGPQRISYPHMRGSDVTLTSQTLMQVGMVTSDEPGIYRPDQWGVRIENLLVTDDVANDTEFGDFLGFETLTLCPISVVPVLFDEMMPDEMNWLNNYHEMVFARLEPYFKNDHETLEWLREKTAPLDFY